MAVPSFIDGTFASARAWLTSQVEQTERLRPLLAATGMVLYLGLLISAIGFTTGRLNTLRATQAELAKLQQLIKDGSWAERRQQSETMRFQLFERFWTAETAGLAEASFERWLRERIEGQGVRPDGIRVQRSPLSSTLDSGEKSPLSDAQRMTAKVVMPFAPEALAQVLNAAATDNKMLVVDRLLIRAGRNALMEMDISTFVILPDQAR